MSSRSIVSTDKAPQAIGPYSQALIAGRMIFLSGQIALEPGTGELVGSNTAEQTERVLENLKAVLEAAGSDMSQVVKTTVYLTDLSEFEAMNAVYTRYFEQAKPARATLAVKALPRGACVEIEAVALRED